jgi:hypothetical protein
VATALTETPLDIVKANKALKTAVKRMVMKPEEVSPCCSMHSFFMQAKTKKILSDRWQATGSAC